MLEPATKPVPARADSAPAPLSVSSKRNSLTSRRRPIPARTTKRASAASISIPVFHYRHVQVKGSSLPRRALHLDRTAVQLDRAVRHRQSQSRAVFFGGEVKLEDFFAFRLGYSRALIGNRDAALPVAPRDGNSELAARPHGLDAIGRDIQDRFFKQ